MRTGGFFAVAASDPDREVLIEPSGARVVAGDLLTMMNRTARGLRAVGIGPGDTIAVVMSNRRELLECYGAAIQSGVFFVAVNWHLSAGELSYILVDSNAKAVFTERRFAEAVARAVDEAGIDRSAVVVVDGSREFRSLPEFVEGQSGAAPSDRSAGQIMFYTSGTTGRPKGVRKSFRAAPSDELTLSSGIGPIGRVAQSANSRGPSVTGIVCLASGPFYHGMPIASAVATMDDGGSVVMMDKWTPETFLDLIERHRVTYANLVPTMFHRLLALPEEVRKRADVSSLRLVSHAGAPCPVEVKRRMIEWWGPIITESYSSTEGAGTTATSDEWLRKPGTVGRPNPGVSIKILDDDGKELPRGEQGLVYLTPALWDFEYHHDPDKTQSAHHGDMFTVGDIGYLDDDGYLFLCDRKADTIISGGVNIYPAEVEAVLLQHPAVRDAAVIGVPNEEWGEEVRAVVETYDPAGGTSDLEAELIRLCHSRIARFKCPRVVDFVETLDRDPNGKLRKGVIRAKYWPEGARRI